MLCLCIHVFVRRGGYVCCEGKLRLFWHGGGKEISLSDVGGCWRAERCNLDYIYIYYIYDR